MADDMSPSPLAHEVIEPARLRAALHTTGTTQAALARALEVDVSTISKWLRGDRPIHRVAWYACSYVLELPKGWTPPHAKPAPD